MSVEVCVCVCVSTGAQGRPKWHPLGTIGLRGGGGTWGPLGPHVGILGFVDFD